MAISSINKQPGPAYGVPLGVNTATLNGQLFNGIINTDDYWLTQDDIHPDWHPLRSHPLGTIPLASYPISIDPESLRDFTGDYRLEIRSNLGELLGELTYWSNASWVQSVNEPDTLTFVYPADESITANMSDPNEVWLYRGRSVYPEQAFIIRRTSSTDADMRVIQVSCEGVLSQWGFEVIRSYEPAEMKSVKQILLDWVHDYQQISPGIYVGSIDSSIASNVIAVGVKNQTMLQAFRTLHELFGGYFYCTPQRRLCWKAAIGNDQGHVIRYGRNATAINRTIDYTTINNRLIATANVAGVATTVEKNDTASQAIYGIRTGYYQGPDVAKLSDLNALANAELTRRSAAQETISVGMIDLSHTDRYDYTFDATALDLGSRINLVSIESEMAIQCRVYTITRTLDEPSQVTIEVGDATTGIGATVTFKPRQDFIRAVSGLMKYVQTQLQKNAT